VLFRSVKGLDFQGPAQEPTASLLDKTEARSIYDSLVNKVRDPALMEFVGYNLVRTSVFPVEAHGAQKVRLTYEYMVGTLSFYREARERSRGLFKGLEAEGVKTVAFLGARDLAEICFLSLQETSIHLTGIYDDSRAGEDFLGLQVRPEKELDACGADRTVFTKQDWAGRGQLEGKPGVEFLF